MTEKEQQAIPRNERRFDNAPELRNPLKLLYIVQHHHNDSDGSACL